MTRKTGDSVIGVESGLGSHVFHFQNPDPVPNPVIQPGRSGRTDLFASDNFFEFSLYASDGNIGDCG